MIIRRGLPANRTHSFMTDVDADFAERPGIDEHAQNLVKQQAVVRSRIFGNSLFRRDPTNGYTKSISTISPLNCSDIYEEIIGGVDRLAFPARAHWSGTRLLIASGATILAAFVVFFKVNSLQ